jgi:RHS repeat-associated protein
VDGITGENTTYTYDALNRLASATASGMWSESYSYDGFGNLTGKSGTGGAPSMTAGYNAQNQQVGGGATYDANGNQTTANSTTNAFTVENRIKNQTSQIWPNPVAEYAYDPQGRRVMKRTDPDPNSVDNGSSPSWQYNFYGIAGQRLVTLGCTNPSANPLPTCTVQGQNVYYGRKLLVSNGVNVVTDRLGSVRANTQGEKFAYYPYGEERTVTVDSREKFGTYFRDGVGQDYAMARYYGSGTGRFWSPDPGGVRAVRPGNPTSWNRYAYVGGDPANGIDPSGRNEYVIGDETINCRYGDSPYWGNCTGSDGGWGGCGSYFDDDFEDDFDSSPGLPGGACSAQLQYPPAGVPTPPPCNQVLTDDISAYLGSYDGGKSPLDTTANIQELVSAGMDYDVDPRFIVALAVAETQAGTNMKWGPFNAWNVRARNPKYKGKGKKPAYTSWTQAIDAVNDLIAGSYYFGAGRTTTSAIYPAYEGPNYQVGLGNLNTALGQMHGNQNNVTDPCSPVNPRSPNQ